MNLDIEKIYKQAQKYRENQNGKKSGLREVLSTDRVLCTTQ